MPSELQNKRWVSYYSSEIYFMLNKANQASFVLNHCSTHPLVQMKYAKVSTYFIFQRTRPKNPYQQKKGAEAPSNQQQHMWLLHHQFLAEASAGYLYLIGTCWQAYQRQGYMAHGIW